MLLVACADQPLGREELDFLGDLRQYAQKIFCLLNKADYLAPEDLQEAVAFATRLVQETPGAPVPLFAVSAKLVLAQDGLDESARERSGFAALRHALGRFLSEDKSQAWLRSIGGRLLRLLRQERLAQQVAIEAMSAPLVEVETKLQAFRIEKQHTLQSKSDYEALLEADAKRLLKDDVEPALERFKATLKRSVAASVEQRGTNSCRHCRQESSMRRCEKRVIAEVRSACDGWRSVEDAQLAQAVDALCARFSQRIQESADELLRYSADLFSVRYEAIPTDALWRAQADFRYKFWDEPTGLGLLSSSFVLALPRFVGGRLLRERTKAAAAELVETQAGRMRHSFDERLRASVQAFRRDMLARLEATTAALEAAIDTAIQVRRRSELEAERPRNTLQQTARRLERLERRVQEVLG